MRKAITAMASLAALGLAAPVLAADEFSYSYVEVGYLNTDFDDLNVDGDGFGVRGSYGFTPNLHGFASYSDQDFDLNIGYQELQVGMGVNWQVAPRLDLIGTVAYVQAEVDAPGFGSFDDDGFALGASLRGRVTDALELRGGLTFVDLNDSGSDTGFGFGARFYFTPMFALGADVALNDDVTTWTLGARFDFGK